MSPSLKRSVEFAVTGRHFDLRRFHRACSHPEAGAEPGEQDAAWRGRRGGGGRLLPFPLLPIVLVEPVEQTDCAFSVQVLGDDSSK